MKLSGVPGMDAATEAKLAKAGVQRLEDLARVEDADDVAARSGVPVSKLAPLRDAARARIVGLFREAGAPDEGALATADVVRLAGKTGLLVEDVTWFMQNARDEAVRKEDAPPGKVVLSDGSSKARVALGGAWFENVGLVTARADEDGDAKIAKLAGNVVLLREGATEAVARLGGKRHELPIFQAAGGNETRVRVEAVREPGRGFLARLRGK